MSTSMMVSLNGSLVLDKEDGRARLALPSVLTFSLAPSGDNNVPSVPPLALSVVKTWALG